MTESRATSFESESAWLGHVLCRLCSSEASSVGSGFPEPLKSNSLFLNDKHWAKPIVCPPVVHFTRLCYKGKGYCSLYFRYGMSWFGEVTVIWEGKPESTTTSFRSRPLAVNFAVMFCKGSKGDGRLLASLSLAVKPSRRPKGTAQNGPPPWENILRKW